MNVSGAHRLTRTLGRWRRRLEPRVVVLMYHRVADVPCDPWDQCVSPDRFHEQLDVLKRHVDVIPLADVPDVLVRGARTLRAAAITFDDGYADNLHSARPILDYHGLPGTFFLATGALDQDHEFWWDELERIFLYPGTLPDKLELTVSGVRTAWSLDREAELSAEAWQKHRMWRAWTSPETSRQRVYYAVWNLLRPLPSEAQQRILTGLADWAERSRRARATHRLLTTTEARQLVSGENFELGAHSVSHVSLSSQPIGEQIDEIRASRVGIESIMGRPARHFAYPYGDFSDETMVAVREAGFTAAFSTNEGVVGRQGSRWKWPRCKVYNWNREEFSGRLRAMLDHV